MTMPVETSIDVLPIDILVEDDGWVAAEFAAIMAASGIRVSAAVALAPRLRHLGGGGAALRIPVLPRAERMGRACDRARVRSPPRGM